MVEGAFVQPQAQSILDLDVVHAGPFHLPVGKVPVKLKDAGHGEQRWGYRRTAVVQAVHRLEHGIVNERCDDLPELAVETVLRDQLLTNGIGVVEALLSISIFEHVSPF